MSREFAVVYDRAREATLGESARTVARELGCSAGYTDELIFLPDREIDFKKCVFFIFSYKIGKVLILQSRPF